MKKIIAIMLLLSVAIIGYAEDKDKMSHSMKPEVTQEQSTEVSPKMEGTMVEIQLPTVQCGMCQSTIETGLLKVDGINTVHVDVEKLIGHVSYDAQKLDLQKIETAISALGYQANETMAVMESYDKLPMCCKVPETEK